MEKKLLSSVLRRLPRSDLEAGQVKRLGQLLAQLLRHIGHGLERGGRRGPQMTQYLARTIGGLTDPLEERAQARLRRVGR